MSARERTGTVTIVWAGPKSAVRVFANETERRMGNTPFFVEGRVTWLSAITPEVP